MSSDKRQPKNHRTDTAEPTRDAHGQWLPGYCPNPKGRPRKAEKVEANRADIGNFANTELEIMVGGKRVTMTREEALLNKMFEDAMKGKVSNQKFFYDQFQQRKKDLAELIAMYDQLIVKWVINNPSFNEDGVDSIPILEKQKIISLEALLGRTFPNDYPGSFTYLCGYGEE